MALPKAVCSAQMHAGKDLQVAAQALLHCIHACWEKLAWPPFMAAIHGCLNINATGRLPAEPHLQGQCSLQINCTCPCSSCGRVTQQPVAIFSAPHVHCRAAGANLPVAVIACCQICAAKVCDDDVAAGRQQAQCDLCKLCWKRWPSTVHSGGPWRHHQFHHCHWGLCLPRAGGCGALCAASTV